MTPKESLPHAQARPPVQGAARARPPSQPLTRVMALGGVLGPAAFVTAWSVLGWSAADYSPVRESISRLAASGTPTRGAMTAGVVAFSVGVPLYALALRPALSGRAWALAALGGAATLGVAVFPLGSPGRDAAHAACVAVAYVALTALPVVAGRSMARQGRRHWARVSVAAGAATGTLLIASLVSESTGLLQRAGLAVVDLWILATAVDLLRGRAASRGSL